MLLRVRCSSQAPWSACSPAWAPWDGFSRRTKRVSVLFVSRHCWQYNNALRAYPCARQLGCVRTAEPLAAPTGNTAAYSVCCCTWLCRHAADLQPVPAACLQVLRIRQTCSGYLQTTPTSITRSNAPCRFIAQVPSRVLSSACWHACSSWLSSLPPR